MKTTEITREQFKTLTKNPALWNFGNAFWNPVTGEILEEIMARNKFVLRTPKSHLIVKSFETYVLPNL